MVTIRREEPQDVDAIRYINNQAFGQMEEAELVDKLRPEGKAVLSLVATKGVQVIGHIMFSPVTVESESGDFEAITLAPMAVLPEYQHQGVGSKLVRTGLE